MIAGPRVRTPKRTALRSHGLLILLMGTAAWSSICLDLLMTRTEKNCVTPMKSINPWWVSILALQWVQSLIP